MEYIFGKMRRQGQYVEILKTVNDKKHSNLLGFCHVEKQYPNSIDIDDFRIVEKYDSDENEGKYYDWYIIDSHNKTVDKFSIAQPEINKGIADAQDATCELSEIAEESIAALEQAICDLSEEIYGGNK